MRVDLPAPFSPMRAWTSAGKRERSTRSRARVAPKRLRTPWTERRGGAAGSFS
jgi:hypothetical protein